MRDLQDVRVSAGVNNCPVGFNTEPHHGRDVIWKLYFTQVYDTSDQRALLIQKIAKFLATPAGWQCLAAHLSLKGSQISVGVDLAALLDR